MKSYLNNLSNAFLFFVLKLDAEKGYEVGWNNKTNELTL